MKNAFSTGVDEDSVHLTVFGAVLDTSSIQIWAGSRTCWWRSWRVKATFTPQALVLNLDLQLRSDFLVWLLMWFVKCGQYQIPVLSGHGPELTRMCKRTITSTSHTACCSAEVNIEATEVSVYGFIYKLMCSGSQRICERMVMRTRMRRKRVTLFVEQWLLLLYGGVCGCGVGARSGGIVTWMTETETDFVQNFRMPRATFNYVCQRLSLSGPLLKALAARHSVQTTRLLIGWQQGIDLRWHKSRMNSDWDWFTKNLICIWFRTTYESGPNRNWKEQIWATFAFLQSMS